MFELSVRNFCKDCGAEINFGAKFLFHAACHKFARSSELSYSPFTRFAVTMAASSEPFYVRYYSGHSGRFGHEFLEFDFRTLGDGRSASARYANNSNYRNDSLIRKEMCVSSLLIAEIKRIVKESEIMKEDDTKWPEKNKDGRQELEIRLGSEHISFETAKIGSLVDVTESADPEGLRVFYYLVQDLKALVFSLISLHFKIKPI